MKPIPILALLCAFLVLPLTACVSSKAEDLALFEPAALAWPAVETDYLRGIADGIEDGDLTPSDAGVWKSRGDNMSEALEAKDTALLIYAPWQTMKPWAARGIDDAFEDGDIGAGVKASLVEQLAQFTSTISKLQGF